MASCNDREITEADITVAKQNVQTSFAEIKDGGKLSPHATLTFQINHPGNASISKHHQHIVADPAALACLNKKETTAVMLHETGHVHHGIDVLTIPLTMAQLLFTVTAGAAAIFTGIAGCQRHFKTAGKSLLVVGGLWAAQIGNGRLIAEIGRGEELFADRFAARAMGEGQSMASALRKLDGYQPTYSQAPQAKAAEKDRYFKTMMMSNLHYGVWGMYVTHPDTQERIRKLEAYNP